MQTARRIRGALLSAAIAIPTLGLLSQGCMAPDELARLTGLWELERGTATVTFTWTVNEGGEITRSESTGKLEPLDPADFPAELADIIAQWNSAIAELNAALDAALPDAVRLTFPSSVALRIENPDDPTDVGNGLINERSEYLFVGDLSGQAEGDDVGAGGLLRAASVEGRFDVTAETTVGTINRRIALFRAATPNRGVSLTVRIAAAYSGARVGA